MKAIILDIDTLRADHLGCYGYERDTSPAIDAIAAEGIRFDNYYCSDAPCLPSRAALTTGMFGIHSGIVNHGGTTGDLRLMGATRDMRDQRLEESLFNIFRKAGMYTASISTFPERHSSFWFWSGFNEMHNVGKGGNENAGEVMPIALKWIEEHAKQDDWVLHINLWDPHTPYRTPKEFGNPFEKDPMPKWLTQDVVNKHLHAVGPHSLYELNGFTDKTPPHWAMFKDHPGSATTYDEVKNLVDLYDCGIRYVDDYVLQLTSLLKRSGIYDEVAFIITSDHGEAFGELGIYSEHGCCDNVTTRIPMIIKWPGCARGVDTGLHYSLDLLPTLAEIIGTTKGEFWDGESYADILRGKNHNGREYLVLTQGAHVMQRSVRFSDWLYIRTYHDGYHLFPKEMLFNVKDDPFEQSNLSAVRQDICAMACYYLTDWLQQMMETTCCPEDPFWRERLEKGPLHAIGDMEAYCLRLEATGRAAGADALRSRIKTYSESRI